MTRLLGAALGLVAGFIILAVLRSTKTGLPPSGAILSECDGHMSELVIHYEPSAKEIVANAYRDFLGALDRDVTVHVVCPDRLAFEDFSSTLGVVNCTLRPIIAHHAITTWARDRWVALSPQAASGPTTLLSPRGEAAEEIWPARAGDQRVAEDIAAAWVPSVNRGVAGFPVAARASMVVARRSGLYFDGGDFLADAENVFVVARVLQRNVQRTVATRDDVVKILSSELKRRVILIDESPEHHAGMFMASVGGRTMLVGDPTLALGLIPADLADDIGADFRLETQRLFDAVAEQCSAMGYNVVRIPTVPGLDGRTYLTYVNALIDQQGTRRIVYMPTYRGAEPLNDAARQVWERLGYEVRAVDCTSTYRHFGSLHCLVNVLRRS